jgi:hypothetical protein
MFAVGCFHSQEKARQHLLTGFLRFQELGTDPCVRSLSEAQAATAPAEVQLDHFRWMFWSHSQEPIIEISSTWEWPDEPFRLQATRPS